MFATYFAQKIADYLGESHNQFPTPPTNLYLALHSGDPGDAGDANELAGNAYARTEVILEVQAGANSVDLINKLAVVFPTATGNSGSITHWSIRDNATLGAGNVIAHGQWAVPTTWDTGNTFSVAVGDLKLELPTS